MNKSRRLLEEGELDQALFAASEAEKILREIGNPYLRKNLKNLGDISLQRKDPIAAIAYYAEGEEFCRMAEDIGGAYAFVADQGRANAAQGNDSRAVILLRQAANAFDNFGMSDEKIMALEELAKIRHKEQDVRELIDLNRELAFEYRKQGNQRSLARTLFNEGGYILQGNLMSQILPIG